MTFLPGYRGQEIHRKARSGNLENWLQTAALQQHTNPSGNGWSLATERQHWGCAFSFRWRIHAKEIQVGNQCWDPPPKTVQIPYSLMAPRSLVCLCGGIWTLGLHCLCTRWWAHSLFILHPTLVTTFKNTVPNSELNPRLVQLVLLYRSKFGLFEVAGTLISRNTPLTEIWIE